MAIPAQIPPVPGEILPIPSTTVKRDSNGNVTGTDPQIDSAFVTKSYLTNYGASLAAAAAGGTTILTAAVNIASGQLVYATNTGVRPADYTTEAASTVIGIATGSALAGASVTVQYAGVFANFAASSMTPGTPIFLGATGSYTADPTTIPVGSFRTLVGYATTSSNLLVTISEPSHVIAGSSIKMGLGRMIVWPASAPGTIATLPAGYLQCNGQSISRSYYSELYTLMGTTYGSTDGASFSLPDWTSLNVKDSNGLAIGFYVIQAFSDVVYASNIASSFPVGSIYPQYVGFQSPATLFGGTWTDVSSSMPQAVKGGIYDSGTIGGTSYIQYCDGTMEQWASNLRASGTATTVQIGTTTWYYSPAYTWTFAKQFVGSIPVVTSSPANGASYWTGMSDSVSLSQANLYAISSTTTAAPAIHGRAIGKWSAIPYSPITFWQKTSTIGDAASTPPTLVQSAIYDSGTTINGSWIRYTDGTMECWGTVSGTTVGVPSSNFFGSSSGNSFYQYFTVTFPTPVPYINTSYSTNGSETTNYGFAFSASNLTTTGFRILLIGSGSASQPVTGNWRVIGKWSSQSVPAPLGGITVSGIFDSGSNASGNYIRYTDGTMIQWGVTPTLTMNTLNDGYYISTVQAVSYPLSFIDTNATLTVNAKSAAGHLSSALINGTPTASNFGVYGQAWQAAGATCVVNWQAIGKWSNTAVVPQTSQAVLMSGIYDSGSNANGSYIRYSDGTMICWNNGSGTIGTAPWSSWVAVTGGYYATANFTFPQQFINSSVSLTSSGDAGGASLEVFRAQAPSTTGFVFEANSTVNTLTSLTWSWQAIGQWSTTAVKATTSFPTATTSPTVQDLTVIGQRYNKNQVAFEAYLSGSAQAITANTQTKIQLNAVNINIGGFFNTSTYTFTAPYTGTYIFECNIQYLNGTSAHSAMPVNAISSVTNDGDWANYGNTVAVDCNSGQTRLRYLNAGDNVTLWGYNGTTTTISATGRTRMSGYFLG